MYTPLRCGYGMHRDCFKPRFPATGSTQRSTSVSSVSALLFWWSLFYANDRTGYGSSVLYIFTTAVHTSILGALLTFAGAAWYPAYAPTTATWGLSPLEDQQIGGLIMWIPAGVVYLGAGLWLLALWLRESDMVANRRRYAQ